MDDQRHAPPQFHERFNVDIDRGESQRRFINRVHNDIFDSLLKPGLNEDDYFHLTRFLASCLGLRHDPFDLPETYVGDDFLRCLRVLEGCAEALRNSERYSLAENLDRLIRAHLVRAEVDLGVEWTGEVFIKTGAPVLDRALITEPLGRLGDAKYANVVAPFKNGLQHFLQTHKHPELLRDVITDMYEALEALTKVVVGNKDLSGNRERFINALQLSPACGLILKEYIAFANQFRHAARGRRAACAALGRGDRVFCLYDGPLHQDRNHLAARRRRLELLATRATRGQTHDCHNRPSSSC